MNIVWGGQVRRKRERRAGSGFPRSLPLLTLSMPKPKGKTGPSRRNNKNAKRCLAPKLADDYIPASAIDREPDDEGPEDDDSTGLRIKIDVPVAMWVCKTILCGCPHGLLREARISVIATQNAAQGRNLLVSD